MRLKAAMRCLLGVVTVLAQPLSWSDSTPAAAGGTARHEPGLHCAAATSC
jgi:hypothetical protein